jgi:hypothetical protein
LNAAGAEAKSRSRSPGGLDNGSFILVSMQETLDV